MRLSLAQTVALGIVAVACGGCPATMDDSRQAAGNRATFTSAKAPDVLAGCIASAWSAGDTLPASTQRSANGWTVHLTNVNTIVGLVDITPSGKGSAAVYGSAYAAQSKNLLPGIQGCL